MKSLVRPHGGGDLRPLLLGGAEAAAERARAARLPRLRVSSRERGDIVMLGIGGFTPLEGFMGSADWRGVCDGMRTASGLFWPIPITLSASEAQAREITVGQDIALADPDDGHILATMRVDERYSIDKAHECVRVFKTVDDAHPGVKMVMQQGAVNLAGPIKVLSRGGFPEKYGDLFMTPEQTRKLFSSLGWSRIAAFQTRNPMHRSHEYLAKVAIEVCDGVLVHSLLGALKPGDIPAEVRTRAIAALAKNYFVPSTIVQAGYPLDMRYAGPREALLHALFRQNYGCSHLIVGRDHAGVGSYYGPFEAHHIFDEIPTDALQTRPLKIDVSFWCYRCGGMASGRTCPHTDADRLQVSGTQLRKWLSDGHPVPAEFSRPEVLEILREYYAGLESPGLRVAMKICIVSDSHDRADPLAEAVRAAKAEGAEAVIHCGDLIGMQSLKPALAHGLPVHLIHGNNLGDAAALARLERASEGQLRYHGPDARLELAGRRICVVHFDDIGYAMACTGLWHLVCCGHSHRAEVRQVKGVTGDETWLVNPGTVAGLAAPATWALGDLAAMRFEVRTLDG